MFGSKLSLLAASACLGLLVAACQTGAARLETSAPGSEASAEVEAEPTPTPRLGQGTGGDAEVGTYGSDPVKDALYDKCADGDMRSCDDLYRAAGRGTEYELFGGSCGQPEQGIESLSCLEVGPTPTPLPGSGDYYDSTLWLPGYNEKNRAAFISSCSDLDTPEPEAFCGCVFQIIAENVAIEVVDSDSFDFSKLEEADEIFETCYFD